ncbi:PREDICTED: mitogen-activated protein kinase kinase kinase 1-like [Camelina sativa]|uniref:Mitogen-activated protein kinase kinase kinase 1-like n=1 Tax=Camelina sativa TaxID=90675 RepID=A0ABM0VA50_CAMSA|nr:PREDICTED: mitogen-activated protein kinase kinase kinase 1-like [Camelina sativa]
MESVGSNQLSPYVSNRDQRYFLAQPLADRILRALRHRIRLLNRPNGGTFHVLGATCNVYTVTLTATTTCTCPDRQKPCKHILFVLIRVLGLPLDDKCLRQRRLRPCLLYRLLSAPTLPDCLASFHLQQRFLQLFSAATSQPGDTTNSSSSTSQMENEVDEEPATCPICLDDINSIKSVNGENGGGVEKELAVVKCRVCKNKVHEECMLAWRRSRGRRPGICVICRARWRANSSSKSPNVGGSYDNCQGNCYLNLAPYVDEEEEDGVGTSQRPC